MWRGPTALARFATGACAMAIVVVLAVIPPSRLCVPVNVAASNEKSSLLAILAQDYEAGRPTVDGQCVHINVTRVPSGEAEAALERGWDEVSDGAPAPDVWSPAATTWVDLLVFQRRAKGLSNIVPAGASRIIQSPLVIAMPEPMARAMGWGTKEIGWADIFDLAKDPQGWGRYEHPEWGPFKLGKTSPLSSTSGLHALIATYYAAGGKADGSADAGTLGFMRTVESAVVHYGDTVANYLKDLLECDARRQVEQCVSALAIEEKQMLDYNRGNPESKVPAPKGVLPNVELVAIYPRDGTLFADHPYVVLTTDDKTRRAADAFLEYLRSPAIQLRFGRAGFRGYDRDPGPEITTGNRVDPGKPSSVYPLPVPAVIADIQASWRANIRKSARVLLVVDVGGSTAERAPNTSKTKLEVVKDAASAAIDGFGREDEVGLWWYSSTSDGSPPYHEVVPLAPISQQKSVLKHDIEALQPQGQHKALYTTIDAAVASMRASYDSTRINAVVVLTDGGNDDPSNNSLNSLLRTLQGQPRDAFVRIFTVGFGDKAEIDTLEQIALVGRGGSYSDRDPRAIDKILKRVISNF
jgi:Ca-activated chloride channel family protein